MRRIGLLLGVVVFIWLSWFGGSVLLANRSDIRDRSESAFPELSASAFRGKGDKLARNYFQYSAADYQTARQLNLPIILFFTASWCAGCAKQEPIIVELMNRAVGELAKLVAFRVPIAETSVTSEEKALAAEVEVSYPQTIVLINRDGEVVGRYLGETSLPTIQTALEKIF